MGTKIILVYHRINDTSADYNRITVSVRNFREHIEYLNKHFRVINAEDILDYQGTENAVSITFDDGYEDFYTNALPILSLYNTPAALFLSNQNIDTDREMWMTDIYRMLFSHQTFVDNLNFDLYGQTVTLPIVSIADRASACMFLRRVFINSALDEKERILDEIATQLKIGRVGRPEYRMLNCKELDEICHNPLITLGAHTVSHSSLSRLDTKDKRDEIEKSIHYVETITNRKSRLFSYPFGSKNDFDNDVIDILKENGIEKAFTVSNTAVSDSDDRYTIPRFYVCDWTADELRRQIERLLSNQFIEVSKPRSDRYFGKKNNDVIPTDSNIVIWGTGKNAKEVFDFLSDRNHIVAFCDNHKRADEWNGLPVWTLEELLSKADSPIVIVKNSHDMEIVRQLYKHGIRRIHWWI